MSFILDALKKLEQQKKQQESVPDITTVHQAPERVKKKPLWPYILIGALILNILILLNTLWLYKIGTQQATTHEKETQTQIPNTEDSEIHKTQEIDLQTPLLSKGHLPEDQTGNAKPQIDSPYEFLPSTEEVAKLKEKIREEQLSIIHGAIKRETEDLGHSETTAEIMDFENLPSEIKSEIPDLKITGHIFSDNPDNRIININGNIFREGDKISKDLILREITLTGAIFDYKGILFLKKVY